MSRWSFCAAGLLALVASQPLVAADAVTLVQAGPDKLDILIEGKPFATWNSGAELPKPFLLPVRTAAGIVVNRALNDASDADHPHHKGLWNAIDEVNGIQFWAEKGRIRCDKVETGPANATSAAIVVTNSWLNPETDLPELKETALITFHASRLVTYEMTFTAVEKNVVFEDTKEGMFGFRVAPSMKEKNGGHVVASDGSETTAMCWGRTFSWVDYSGPVDGRTVGVTIMDHPGNFRPSRYHVRDYGLFSISPFGEKAYTSGANEAAPLTLEKGKSLNLKYAIYIHDGDAKSADIPVAWDLFVKSTSR